MSEVSIPEEYQRITVVHTKPKYLPQYDVPPRAWVDHRTKKIHLNPEANQAHFEEERLHREQLDILEKAGLRKMWLGIIYRGETGKPLYLNAMEAGVQPQVREFAIKNGFLEETPYNYLGRYLSRLYHFMLNYEGLPPNQQEAFRRVVSGRKPFDGLALAFQLMDEFGPDATKKLPFRTLVPKGFTKEKEEEIWSQVSEARSKW